MSHSPPPHTHVAAAAERAVDDHADDHTQAAPSSSKQPTAQHGFNAFAHLLDPRILRSLAALGFGSPTPVQKEAIPLALAGKDILARASTGSGKTLAYGLPVLQKVIDAKKSLSRSDPAYQATRAMVLVPTRELSEQVTGQIGALLEYCRDQVSIANIARDASSSVQKLLLSERPDIVVATPSRALAYLQSKSLHLAASLESLVIDEADLILSYGHDDDVRALLGGGFLPKSFQSYLMSATMTSDVQKLKGLVMRNPAILKVQDDVATASNLTQYYATVSEEDKFLLTYVILKLRLIKGKCILFVNDVDRCYRLRLFLEQFGLRSVVLNKELPINSRFHIVQEFNKGVYDYLIATDETSIRTAERDDDDDDDEEEGEEKGADASDDDDDNDNATAEAKQSDEDPTATPSKKRKRDAAAKSAAADVASSSKSKNGGGGTGTGTGKSAEFGVSRGIDFVAVSCVINFDLPTSVRSYTHRVGRTARAGATGTSLSFVVPADMVRKHKIIASPTSALDAKVWPRIERAQRARGGVKEWKFDKKQVEGFRYRMQDALRSVTKLSIREARIRELKEEVLKSEKLKAFFEDNPTDLAYLRHDKILGKQTRLQAHMKHVPSYLRPRIVGIKPSASSSSSINEGGGKDGEVGFVAKKAKTQRGRGAGAGAGRGRGGAARGRGGRGGRGGAGGSRGKKSDPLRKFGK